jgi:tetratricopeptide (TPR) repeat protein
MPGDALHHAREALRARPGWSDAYNSAGVALLALGRTDEAKVEFGRALEADPLHASAHVNLGNALVETGALEESIAHYTRAIELEPRNYSAHLNLAMALEDDDRYDEACLAFSRALEQRPGDGIRFKIATMLPVYPRSTQEIDELRNRLAQEIDRLGRGR